VTTSENIARALASIPAVTAKTGTFVGMDGLLAVVNVGASSLKLPIEGRYTLIPGEPVRVQAVAGGYRVTGPTRSRNPRGEVVADSTVDDPLKAVVQVDGVDYELGWNGAYTPMVGDVVIIHWDSLTIIGEESAAPTAEAPGTQPGPTSSFDNLLVQAAQSGRYYGGTLRGDDVWASPSNSGAWFYSGRTSALAGAHVTRSEINLPLFYDANYGGGDLARVGLHTNRDRPGTTPTLSSLVTLSPESGWVRLPDGWGNLLRDNPDWGVGVDVPSSGFFRWRSVQSDPMSGALRFAGTR
jgi:hypothetical protein